MSESPNKLSRLSLPPAAPWLAAFAIFAFVYLSVPLRAATLTVFTTANSGPGSLRDQIAASNPGDTIVFTVTGTIALNGSITIANSISILGPGPSLLTVSGSGVDRVFFISANPVFLSGVTIRDGKVIAPNGVDGGTGQNGTPGTDAQGGAIYDTGGDLTLSNCWFTANRVIAGNGGRGGDNPLGAAFTPGHGGDGGVGSGGAIYDPGTVTAIRCTFSANQAVGGNGGNGGDNLNFIVSQSGGKGGTGGVGEHGAFFGSGSGPYLTLCTMSGNLAAGGNGGNGGATAAATVGGTGGDGNTGQCGACDVSALGSITSCTIVSNRASGGAAGAGGTGSPNGPPGNAGSGYVGALCGYAIVCQPWLGNTILAQNIADLHSNAYVFFKDAGYNFVGDNDNPGACFGGTSRVGTVPAPLDPLLGPLAQNGAGLPTHKPLLNSPVLDTGTGLGLTTDERGAPRPYDLPNYPNADDASDVGAFEASKTDLGLGVISNNVVVSWPAWSGDSVLQSSPTLGPASNWTTVSNEPVVAGDRFYVTNSIAGAQRFYRLIDR